MTKKRAIDLQSGDILFVAGVRLGILVEDPQHIGYGLFSAKLQDFDEVREFAWYEGAEVTVQEWQPSQAV